MKKKSLIMVMGLMMLMVICGTANVPQAFASKGTIDYISSSVSPEADFHGGSGNFDLINPVVGGTDITFTLTFHVVPGGSSGAQTSYPKTVTFSPGSYTTPAGASNPVVKFGPAPGTATYTGTFSKDATTGTINDLSTTVKITTPSTPGAYSLKIAASSGLGSGSTELLGGSGVVIGFSVQTSCADAATLLDLTIPDCIVLHDTNPATFSATLTSAGQPVNGKTINFLVDTILVGSATTVNGVATISPVLSELNAGDHTVLAEFQGDGCDFHSSTANKTLGVMYNFVGFQPPVEIEGVGAGLFSGKVIPIKIKIADAGGMPVPGAQALVLFAQTVPNVTTEEAAESVNLTDADPGNQMRYDPVADQYIYNWDTSKLPNGGYNIRIDLDEGTQCGSGHLATVVLQKSGGKKK
jgi:hypothetical protein